MRANGRQEYIMRIFHYPPTNTSSSVGGGFEFGFSFDSSSALSRRRRGSSSSGLSRRQRYRKQTRRRSDLHIIIFTPSRGSERDVRVSERRLRATTEGKFAGSESGGSPASL